VGIPQSNQRADTREVVQGVTDYIYIVISTNPGDDWKSYIEAVFLDLEAARAFKDKYNVEHRKGCTCYPNDPTIGCDYAWVERWTTDGVKRKEVWDEKLGRYVGVGEDPNW
jgi:hypothetical protein